MLERQKLALVAGHWANSNYDKQEESQTEAPRKAMLIDIEEWFQKAVEVVYGERISEHDEALITKEDENNPFLRPAIMATRKGNAELAKLDVPPDATVGDVANDKIEIDQ